MHSATVNEMLGKLSEYWDSVSLEWQWRSPYSDGHSVLVCKGDGNKRWFGNDIEDLVSRAMLQSMHEKKEEDKNTILSSLYQMLEERNKKAGAYQETIAFWIEELRRTADELEGVG